MPGTILPACWLGKPYYSLDAYFKNTYGHKCYKIALNAQMTCPNRDGTLGTRGCLFCSAGGSGEFAASEADIHRQIKAGLALLGQKQAGQHFIAYFQAYTNTYAPVERLRTLYTQALEHPIPWYAASPLPPGRTVSRGPCWSYWRSCARPIRTNLSG